MSVDKDFSGRVSRALGIPEEAAGLPHIEITGVSVTVSNHKGILEYGENEINVRSRGGIIRIRGQELRICRMDSDTLTVGGRIYSVELGV